MYPYPFLKAVPVLN